VFLNHIIILIIIMSEEKNTKLAEPTGCDEVVV